jgi:Arc/MetJ family transcription regulator
VAVTKALVEIDDDYLAAAQQALGTTTKKDTVNAALREFTALAAPRSAKAHQSRWPLPCRLVTRKST